jgi:hypothetical protein
MQEALQFLRNKLFTLPQPVACALGRVCRNSGEQELVEFSVKAGEVLARYLAALALSSFCARDDEQNPVSLELETFTGPLSFGHFVSVLQVISRSSTTHPLKIYLKAGFGLGRPTETALENLLRIRNKHGHALEGLTVPKAKKIISIDQPLQSLVEAVKGSQGLLDHPLFLLEEQRFSKQVYTGRRLLLMGDSEPIPDKVELSTGLDEIGIAYLGVKGGVLRLPPFLIWDIVEARSSFGVYLLHKIGETKTDYVTVFDDEREESTSELLVRLTGGELQPMEKVFLKDGRDFFREWVQKKRALEQVAELSQGVIPWDSFDQATLKWYESRLKVSDSVKPQKLGRRITQQLLDGRDVINPDEVGQLLILFGTRGAVTKRVRRPLIDCRARSTGSMERWNERVEGSDNVIQSLKQAIEFFSRHLGIDGATIDGLTATIGSADYIAMREALVNLFVHQDYNDASAAGQIDIRDDRTIFHNAGCSLVTTESLVEGGKSTSRNPLIGRALRLIGFAELAGSGLYAVHSAWRKARRRPPKIDSDSKANTFTLTLDWRALEEQIDEFWMKKLGVKLSPQQAAVLSILVTPEPFTLEQIASASGMYLSDAKAVIDYLKLQALIVTTEDKFGLRSDLYELAANRDEAQ